MKAFRFIGLFVVLLCNGCNIEIDKSEQEVLEKIEKKLGINSSEISSQGLSKRLGKILKELDTKTNYDEIVLINRYRDTIKMGEDYSFTVSHQIYFPNDTATAFLYDVNGEKFVKDQSERGIFGFRVKDYEEGQNIYKGAIFYRGDSLYYDCSFYVEP